MGSESRVQEDLSTTGGLGDNEGMDSTIAHADPDHEEMTSSSEPWPEPKTQRSKRRRLSNETELEDNRMGNDTDVEANRNKDNEEMEVEEASAQGPMVEAPTNETPIMVETPTNGTPMMRTPINETLEAERQKEAIKMAQEIEILKEQNKHQMEQHQRVAEALNRNMEEKIVREREAMAREIQEMRVIMDQERAARQIAVGNQGNPGNLEPQNENPEALGAASLPVAPEAARVQNNNPQNNGNIAVNAGDPEIIAITDQNRHLISDSLGGMIVLPNGTLRLTPQFITKQKNPNVQRMKKHSRTPTQTP